MTRTARDVKADIEALESFADSYRLFYNVPDEEGRVPVLRGDRTQLRRTIHRKLGRAERAMEAAGANGFGISPPPMIGGPPRQGLTATAFAGEEPLFQSEPPVHELVLDRVEFAIGILEDELAEVGPADERPPAAALADPSLRPRGMGASHFPRLILERVVKGAPRWAVAIERLLFASAAIATIIGTVGLIAGWW